MTNPFVSVSDIEDVIGRPLTDPESIRVSIALSAVLLTLEGWLDRDTYQREYEDEKHVFVFDLERLKPYHGPVVGSITVKSEPGTSGTSAVYPNWELQAFSAGEVVYIDYTSGDDVNGPYAPLYKSIIMDAITASIIRGTAVDTGAIGGYTVEGTSITYRDFSSNTSVGKIEVASLNSVEFLRRRLVR